MQRKIQKGQTQKKSRTGPDIVAQLLKNTIVVNNCVIIFWAEEKPNISNKNNAFLLHNYIRKFKCWQNYMTT